jgi:hypothetical protein
MSEVENWKKQKLLEAKAKTVRSEILSILDNLEKAAGKDPELEEVLIKYLDTKGEELELIRKELAFLKGIPSNVEEKMTNEGAKIFRNLSRGVFLGRREK